MGHVDPHVGTLTKGLYADLFLLKGDARDPYKALATAKPQDVTLTMVNGQPVYGAAQNLTALDTAKIESIEVCGTGRAFNSIALPSSYADLRARLAKRLKAFGIDLAPLVYCR
jgi:hypothetical protein